MVQGLGGIFALNGEYVGSNLTSTYGNIGDKETTWIGINAT